MRRTPSGLRKRAARLQRAPVPVGMARASVQTVPARATMAAARLQNGSVSLRERSARVQNPSLQGKVARDGVQSASRRVLRHRNPLQLWADSSRVSVATNGPSVRVGAAASGLGPSLGAETVAGEPVADEPVADESGAAETAAVPKRVRGVLRPEGSGPTTPRVVSAPPGSARAGRSPR